MKDRDAEHQRWADRQELTADVLREAVEAAGARAAEISEWLDSSFLPDDPDSVFGASPQRSGEPDPDQQEPSGAVTEKARPLRTPSKA